MAKTLGQDNESKGLRGRFKGSYSSIGLDLGTSQCKLVQLKEKKGEAYLHQYGIYPLPEGALEGGRVIEPEMLADRLRWIVKRRRFYKKRVNLCIGSQSVILRTVQLPRLPEKEIPAALRFEAEKQIMIPMDEAVLDYIYLGDRVEEDKEVTELALVAAPKDVLEGYIEAVIRSGLHPDVIEIEPFALQRTASVLLEGVFNHKSGEAVMVLDLGGESSNVLLIENNQYSFARSLSIGANHFCRRVAEKREISFEAAQRLVFGPEPFAVEGVQEIADELVSQIQRSMEFYVYNVEKGQQEIRQLFVCGGGFIMERLCSFLGFELKMEPAHLNPLKIVQTNKMFLAPDLERDSGMLNIAFGLALRGWMQ